MPPGLFASLIHCGALSCRRSARPFMNAISMRSTTALYSVISINRRGKPQSRSSKRRLVNADPLCGW